MFIELVKKLSLPQWWLEYRGALQTWRPRGKIDEGAFVDGRSSIARLASSADDITTYPANGNRAEHRANLW